MAAIRGGTIINIAGTTPVEDPTYRYRMPAVFGKIEGRGNGIKTVLPNVTDVALSLHREPAEVTKFFGTELGAQTSFTITTDRAVVNGAHTDGVLQELIHRYIEGFVLCPNCRLPETVYKIKNECIYHKCAACGAKEMLDMNHKLVTFILAQDKKAKKEAKKNGKKDKDKDKDAKKDKKKKNKESSDDEKKKKKKDKKKEKKDKKKEKNGDDEDGDYLEKAMFGKNKNQDDLDELADDQESQASETGVDDAGAMKLAVDGTKQYLADNPEATPHEVAEVVTNQQMASALKAHDRIHIFVQAAFTLQFYKSGEVERFAPIVSLITHDSRILERHLIAALEVLCVDRPKSFALILKQMYDEDALSEEAILEWADEGRTEFTRVDEDSRSKLRGEAEPVVVWLQEADSDDEDEDDEDE